MEQIEAQKLLQIGEGASPAEINEAFRKRVQEVRKQFYAARKRKNRADREECEALFEKLKKARGLLIDPPVPPPPIDPISLQDITTGMVLAGRFELRRELGHGAMGVVWLASDRTLHREVALKFLPDLIAHDKVAANDLREETRRSIELSHPGIARVYDFVEDRGRVAISMEYIDGQTLSELRLGKPNQLFEARELAIWVRELCEALEYAHQRAMLTHCDINPSNLMVNSKGHLQITDFGIAKRIPDSMIRLDPAHGTSGALTYMSPQQALGQKPNVSDDVYSVGATLYELLTSKPPFYQGEIWVQLKENIPPSLAERRAELAIEGEPIPENWEETVAACLAKDPSRRPESAMKVAQRLEKLSFPPPIVAGETSPASPDPPPTRVAPPSEPIPGPVSPSPQPIEPEPSPIEPAQTPIDPALLPIHPALSPIEPGLAVIDPTPSPINPALAIIQPALTSDDPAKAAIDPAASTIHPAVAPIHQRPSSSDKPADSTIGRPGMVDPRSKTVTKEGSPFRTWLRQNTRLAIGGAVSFLVIALVGVLAWFNWLNQHKPGRLILNTVPSSATVFLDGTLCGPTPLILERLVPGERHVRIALEGYEEEQLIVVVKPGDPGTFPLIRLVSKRGPLPTATPSPTAVSVTPSPSAASVSPNPGGFRGERYPQTRERLLTESEIASMDLADIRYALNEMYARHGAPFSKEPDIQKQFQSFDWYHPVPGLTLPQVEAAFSTTENKNRDLLARLRDQKRPR